MGGRQGKGTCVLRCYRYGGGDSGDDDYMQLLGMVGKGKRKVVMVVKYLVI